VCVELERRRYEILQCLTDPRAHGHEIIAVKTGRRRGELYVEAKGQTSSKKTTPRFGKPFSETQVESHVARAFHKASAVISQPPSDNDVRAAIAFPDTPRHRACVEKIAPALKSLRIGVFWVDEKDSARCTTHRGSCRQ